jgi:hypothetical protein
VSQMRAPVPECTLAETSLPHRVQLMTTFTTGQVLYKGRYAATSSNLRWPFLPSDAASRESVQAATPYEGGLFFLSITFKCVIA